MHTHAQHLHENITDHLGSLTLSFSLLSLSISSTAAHTLSHLSSSLHTPFSIEQSSVTSVCSVLDVCIRMSTCGLLVQITLSFLSPPPAPIFSLSHAHTLLTFHAGRELL